MEFPETPLERIARYDRQHAAGLITAGERDEQVALVRSECADWFRPSGLGATPL